MEEAQYQAIFNYKTNKKEYPTLILGSTINVYKIQNGVSDCGLYAIAFERPLHLL